MIINYDPFAEIEDSEDLYYKAAVAGFNTLEEYYALRISEYTYKCGILNYKIKDSKLL